MSLSSVCVVMNALRLRRFSIDRTAEESSASGKAAINIESIEVQNEEEIGLTTELKIEGMMCKHCVRRDGGRRKSRRGEGGRDFGAGNSGVGV